jgi:hypothetical protein
MEEIDLLSGNLMFVVFSTISKLLEVQLFWRHDTQQNDTLVKTLNKMTRRIMALSIMTHDITKLSIMTCCTMIA